MAPQAVVAAAARRVVALRLRVKRWRLTPSPDQGRQVIRARVVQQVKHRPVPAITCSRTARRRRTTTGDERLDTAEQQHGIVWPTSTTRAASRPAIIDLAPPSAIDPLPGLQPAATPELDSLALMGSGLSAFGLYALNRWRARRRSPGGVRAFALARPSRSATPRRRPASRRPGHARPGHGRSDRRCPRRRPC